MHTRTAPVVPRPSAGVDLRNRVGGATGSGEALPDVARAPCRPVRGKGYATEAGRAVLALAEQAFRGELLAMIDPTNTASRNVARKLGFTFSKQAVVHGFLDDLYRLQVGRSTPSDGSPP